MQKSSAGFTRVPHLRGMTQFFLLQSLKLLTVCACELEMNIMSTTIVIVWVCQLHCLVHGVNNHSHCCLMPDQNPILEVGAASHSRKLCVDEGAYITYFTIEVMTWTFLLTQFVKSMSNLDNCRWQGVGTIFIANYLNMQRSLFTLCLQVGNPKAKKNVAC